MPALIPVVVAAAATIGTAAAATAAGITIAGLSVATTALLLGGIAGTVVATVGNMVLSSLTRASKTTASSAIDRKQAVRSAIAPRRIVYGRCMVSGPVVYIGSSGSDNEYFHIVIPLAAHPIDAVEQVKVNSNLITLVSPGTSGALDALDRAGGALSGTIRIHTYDGTQGTADAALMAECPADWTAAHKLLGTPYLAIRIKYDPNIYPNGFESIAAVVRGRRVYDPRSGSAAWSANAALCIRDYLTADYGLACDTDEIDDDYFEIAANICDETVALDVANTIFQPRFALNGSEALDVTPVDIVERLLSACGGTLVYVQGAYRLHVAAYDAPAVTLGPSDFAGNVQVTTAHSRAALFNQVRGTFIDATQQWTAVEFPLVKLDDAVAADGEDIAIDTELDFTTDRAMAQRLARIQLLRARYPITLTAPLKYSALRVAAWDTVGVTLPDLGWSGKVFRVQAWRFDPVTAGVTVTLQEEHSSAYAWTALDAAPPLDTPDTSLIDPLAVPLPTGGSITQTTAINADGVVVPAIRVGWTAPAHPFVTSTNLEWRKTGETAWNVIDIPRPATQGLIVPAISGQSYDIRLRFAAGLARGPYTGTSTVTGAADTTAPGLPSSVAAFAVRGGISITWIKPSDLDLAAIEVWEASTSGGGFGFVGESSGSRFLRSGLTGTATRYYKLRSRDATGNRSGFTGEVSAAPDAAGTDDIAANAVTQGYYARDFSTETSLVPTDGFTAITAVSVSVPAGGIVRLSLRLDLQISDSLDGYGGPGGPEGGGV